MENQWKCPQNSSLVYKVEFKEIKLTNQNQKGNQARISLDKLKRNQKDKRTNWNLLKFKKSQKIKKTKRNQNKSQEKTKDKEKPKEKENSKKHSIKAIKTSLKMRPNIEWASDLQTNWILNSFWLMKLKEEKLFKSSTSKLRTSWSHWGISN